MAEPDDTIQLLRDWYEGDARALAALLDENLEWMRARVRQQLPARLRPRLDSMDVVQDGVLRLLKYGPRFASANRAQFRGLLLKILVSALRDRLDHEHAAQRDVDGERALASQSALQPPGDSLEDPAGRAERAEEQHWIRLGLELLEEQERRLIVLRNQEARSWAEIAEALGLEKPDAARMRFNRALPKLAAHVARLKSAVSRADWS